LAEEMLIGWVRHGRGDVLSIGPGRLLVRRGFYLLILGLS
jgi:hypothetical protein